MTVAHRILDLARWAPSGDNTQPWRFEVRSEAEILVHGYDTRKHCVYDLDGWASQLSHGALLETLALAATRFGQRATVSETIEHTPQHIVYRVLLRADGNIVEDPLVASISERTVQRRLMDMNPLTRMQKEAVEAAARPFDVVWFESLRARREVATLNYANAFIRMSIPEAFEVHRAVIDFDAVTSDDRLPGASLGANPLLLATMRWTMSSWGRMNRVNRWMGTAAPRVMLDWLPGVFCSAHFALIGHGEGNRISERVQAGGAVQRCWLAATAHGLQQQPSYTPLVFARYAREGRRFTTIGRARDHALRIAERLDRLLGSNEARRAVWLGRLGRAKRSSGRSLRLPLARLLVERAPDELETALDR
jgi:nitroreductase